MSAWSGKWITCQVNLKNYLCTRLKTKRRMGQGTILTFRAKARRRIEIVISPTENLRSKRQYFFQFSVILSFWVFFPRLSALPAPHSTSISLLGIFSLYLCSGLRNNFLRNNNFHESESSRRGKVRAK